MKINTTQPVICSTYIAPLQRYKIKASAAKEVAEIVERINKNKAQYQRLEELTGAPWEFTAALHNLECSGRFDQHLANGDPVDRPTVNEPSGIPGGAWLNTAVAAYHVKNWVGRSDLDWDNKLLWLWRAEIWWNGDGYRHKSFEHRSPYLWAGTTEEMRGKYVSDGVWDANAMSEQIGCVAIWDALGVKLMEGRSVEINGNDLGLEKIIEDEKPIGRLIATRNTWMKNQPIDSTALSDTEKKRFVRDEAVVIYERLADLAHHYQVVIKPDNQKKLAYVYQDHAGITIDGEDGDSRPVSLMVSDVSNLSKSGGSIAVGDKKAIQEHLILVGLLDPIADGKWGSLSQSAWRAFTRVIGQESEDISQAAVDRLGSIRSFKDLDFKPKDPSDAENVLVTRAIKKMVDMGFHVAISMGSDALSYNLFYLAGTNPDSSLNNDLVDTFNDLRCLVSISSQGVVTKHGVWIATVDAGNYWRGSRRMNEDGALQVDKNVQFLNLSCVGKHGQRSYEALVQVGELTATRDRTGNGRTKDDTTDRGSHFGSNDHHAWDADINNVSMHSAGCCVGRTISGHQKFMSIIKTDRRYRCNNGYAWHRTILDGKLFST